MSSPEKSRPGCFRIGCCSCLALILISIAGLGGLAGMQVLYERNAGPQLTEDLQRQLPTLPDFQRLVASGELGNEQPLDLSSSPLATFGSFENLLAKTGMGVVRVEFDMDFGEFTIEPGEPGAGVVIEARYDERALALSEEFETSPDGGGVMRIRSRPRGGRLGLMLRGAGRGPKNFVTIKLPPDVPLDLVGEFGLGEGDLELGGLLLRNVDLAFGTGDHEIAFSEPLLAPMQSMRVRKGIGAMRILALGHASPASVDIVQSVGELDVGLEGVWQNDAEIALRNRVGELNVKPPTTADLRMSGGVTIGERNGSAPRLDLPEGAPVLTLHVSGGVGEITVHH